MSQATEWLEHQWEGQPPKVLTTDASRGCPAQLSDPQWPHLHRLEMQTLQGKAELMNMVFLHLHPLVHLALGNKSQRSSISVVPLNRHWCSGTCSEARGPIKRGWQDDTALSQVYRKMAGTSTVFY